MGLALAPSQETAGVFLSGMLAVRGGADVETPGSRLRLCGRLRFKRYRAAFE